MDLAPLSKRFNFDRILSRKCGTVNRYSGKTVKFVQNIKEKLENFQKTMLL